MNREQQVQNSLAIKVAELTLQVAQLSADLQISQQEVQELQSKLPAEDNTEVTE